MEFTSLYCRCCSSLLSSPVWKEKCLFARNLLQSGRLAVKGFFVTVSPWVAKPAALSDITASRSQFQNCKKNKTSVRMTHTAKWTSAIFLLNIVDNFKLFLTRQTICLFVIAVVVVCFLLLCRKLAFKKTCPVTFKVKCIFKPVHTIGGLLSFFISVLFSEAAYLFD